MTENNEKLVRAFYEATVPGHREPLGGVETADVVHEVPQGICIGGDRSDGMTDLEHLFHEFCAAFWCPLCRGGVYHDGRARRRDRSYQRRNERR